MDDSNSTVWPKSDAYYLALGRFNDAFTIAEVELTVFVASFAHYGADRLQYRVIKSLLGGMRMQASKDAFNRILRVLGQPAPVTEYVGGVFSQLGEIQFLRDRLAHHMTVRSVTDPSRKTFMNLDIMVVREQEKALSLSFETAALDAATADVRLIPFLLSDICQGVKEEKPMPALEPPTWQYKPSMLAR